MKKCAFTIVAKNYIGLAQILEHSIKAQHDDVDFWIFVADEMENSHQLNCQRIIFAKQSLGYDAETWTSMAFKYDLTEFCTTIKPACFQHLMALGYDHLIYFDPDIYVFSPLTDIFHWLDQYHMVLTPQVRNIHVDYPGEHPEWAMNVNGIFNLGFCAVRNSPLIADIMQWWRTRLIDNSFADRSVGNFTDQKWMDWMPALLGTERLYVSRHLGMNMAPWNFFERRLFMDGNRIMVANRQVYSPDESQPLVFLHFAGYDYQQLKKGVVARKRIETLKDYDDIHLAADIYSQALVREQHLFDNFINQTYSYATYENGEQIASFHRRLYHGMLLNGQNMSNPFATGSGSFYQAIKKRGMTGHAPVDRLSRSTISNIEGKRKMIALLFSILYRLIGYKRYVPFVKSLYDYCRPEFHTFLIKKPK